MPYHINEVANGINGRVFLEFLLERGVKEIELYPGDLNCHGSYSKWRRGDNLSIDRADRFLTRLGYHLWELPNEAWIINYAPQKEGRKGRNIKYASFSFS
jgi:hypothetical protein